MNSNHAETSSPRRPSELPVLVSACLLGVHCRYDGSTNPCSELAAKIGSRAVIPICPEEFGGLSTPRPAAECCGGTGADVLTGNAKILVKESGKDVTEQFLSGAHEALRLARKFGADSALLKSKSPSCGCGKVYRDGQLVNGDGVTAALLKRAGIAVEAIDA
ncbi:MAG: DUF523 domain-containing protein [Planctomycetota bacterium]|nr:DUF523 domain-containing protein [Planctomycetota bacterium]MDA1139715.1 DUF523 domain-containing protein [Planctomycetota bacterium]